VNVAFPSENVNATCAKRDISQPSMAGKVIPLLSRKKTEVVAFETIELGRHRRANQLRARADLTIPVIFPPGAALEGLGERAFPNKQQQCQQNCNLHGPVGLFGCASSLLLDTWSVTAPSNFSSTSLRCFTTPQLIGSWVRLLHRF